jgi:hypothetical protein
MLLKPVSRMCDIKSGSVNNDSLSVLLIPQIARQPQTSKHKHLFKSDICDDVAYWPCPTAYWLQHVLEQG